MSGSHCKKENMIFDLLQKGRVAGESEDNAGRRYEVQVNPPSQQTRNRRSFSTHGHGLSCVGSTSCLGFQYLTMS
jgi:hypothetical protein